MIWNYARIKREAKERGIHINDLCALAPKNDAFYTGRKSEVAAAEWFADLWKRFGCSQGTHLRRVHYQIISQREPIALPTILSWKDDEKVRHETDVYLNVNRCWQYLCLTGKWARYLNLVAPEAFVDRRNPEAILNTDWRTPGDWGWEDPTPGYKMVKAEESLDELPELPELPSIEPRLPDLPGLETTGYCTEWGNSLNQQAYHIEIWAEKTTMHDILEPLCQQYNVNLIAGLGEMSITSVVDFMERVKKSQRPARILYISDYDPAGLGMPISVARKIEFFQQQSRDDTDIRLQPIVLTSDQVSEFNLPRVPVKDTDLRKAGWEESHGEGQVELDALEALHPGQLERIVEDAIFQYFDADLASKTKDARDHLAERLESEREDVLETYQGKHDSIELAYSELVDEMLRLEKEFDKLVEPFQARVDAHAETMRGIKQNWENLTDNIRYELECVEVDLEAEDFVLPEPDLQDESDALLYVSERDYLEQLANYKAYRNGE